MVSHRVFNTAGIHKKRKDRHALIVPHRNDMHLHTTVASIELSTYMIPCTIFPVTGKSGIRNSTPPCPIHRTSCISRHSALQHRTCPKNASSASPCLPTPFSATPQRYREYTYQTYPYLQPQCFHFYSVHKKGWQFLLPALSGSKSLSPVTRSKTLRTRRKHNHFLTNP